MNYTRVINRARGVRGAKKITERSLIGERGVALIRKRVLDMGYVWHDRRVDAGIDGEIELRDPATEFALNRLILVQSKASEQPFTRETATSFEYPCSPADLAYWLDGNAPVLLVCSHPSTDEAWWVSIKDYFADPARRASRRVQFDKRAMRFDAAAAPALFDLAMPAESGLYLPPPPRREQLTSNLLVVTSVPARIHSAPTCATDGADAVARLAAVDARDRDFLLRGGQVHSFRPLTEAPFSTLVAGNPAAVSTSVPTSTWADSKASAKCGVGWIVGEDWPGTNVWQVRTPAMMGVSAPMTPLEARACPHIIAHPRRRAAAGCARRVGTRPVQ